LDNTSKLKSLLKASESFSISPIAFFYRKNISLALSRVPVEIETIGGKQKKFRYVSLNSESLSFAAQISDFKRVLENLDKLLDSGYLGDSPSKNRAFIYKLSEEMIASAWDEGVRKKSELVLPGSEGIKSTYGLIPDRLCGWGKFTLQFLKKDPYSRRNYWSIWDVRADSFALSEDSIRVPCYIGIQTYRRSDLKEALEFVTFWRSVEIVNFVNDLYSFTKLFCDFCLRTKEELGTSGASFTHFIGNLHVILGSSSSA